jgi:tetratricopeptide (TPR) repeat protein
MNDKTGKAPKKLEKITGNLRSKAVPNEELNALLQQIVIHLKAKDLPKLAPALAAASALAPDDARVLHFQGLSAFEQRDAPTAFTFLRRALEKRPNDSALQHNMAAVLISLGKFEKAEELLRAAVKTKPDYAEAYHTLSPIRKFTADDPLIPLMEKGLQSPNLSDADTSFYAFALAKACDDAGLYDRGWPALARGNAVMPHAFDPKLEDTAVEAILKNATRDRLQELGQYGQPTRAPIFIVGMPRSGTTLLESVIADHPQVFAAGELTALSRIGIAVTANLKAPQNLAGFADVLDKLTPEHVYAAGLGYLNGARATATGWFDHYVDKLPDNSFNLGLAAAIVPGARVVHIMRHPLDIMLSIYFQRFTSVRYCFQPADILHHYKNYQRVMAHWRDHLPMDMVELRYENLVQDVDFARDWLWQHLGLTPNIDHVPNPGASGQQRTASRFQVRQPVYQTSTEKFRRYEAHMGEFIEGLGGMAAIEAEVAAQENRCALRKAADT